jgi:hypothetical protein
MYMGEVIVLVLMVAWKRGADRDVARVRLSGRAHVVTSDGLLDRAGRRLSHA